MGYKLAIRLIEAPLSVEHAILWLSDTPDTGYFVGQDAWNATAALELDDPTSTLDSTLSDDELVRIRKAEKIRREKIEAMRTRLIAKAAKNGPLRNAIIRAAQDRPADVERLAADPIATLDAVAVTLELGDGIAYVDDNPLGPLLANVRVLSLDDADAIVAAVERARKDVAEGKTRIPAEFVRELPLPKDVRTFVEARIGSVILIEKA